MGDGPSDEVEIPPHIVKRREQFENDKKHLGQAGLKLSPEYEGLYFSDDEKDPGELQERPQLDDVKPCRPYKDIVLEASAGLIPASIAQYLRDYQVEGVKFLHERFVYQKGAVLGDDMGLGKTVQVAAFLAAAFGKTGDERDAKRLRKVRRDSSRWYPRVLIVCPGSLIPNWKSELKRWGWWKIDAYHESGKEDALRAARNGAIEIMLTTYTTYTHNEDKLNSVEWDAVVADECHIIKDRRSATTKAMNKINALCRIGLTGTAIQNKYEEFWTLLNWTNPGYFGNLREWNTSIGKPLTRGQSHEATIQQLSLARKTAKKLVENLLPNFFLRRMKALIADQLPKKTDRVIFCPLTDLQKDAYKRLLEGEAIRTILMSVEDCVCGSGLKQGWCCGQRTSDAGKPWTSLVFPCIISLQKLSNHLTLLIPKNEKDIEKRKAALMLLEQCAPKHWETLYQQRDSIQVLTNPAFCGKWKILKELLSLWHKNQDKVLVFSHSVQLLHILESLFKNTSYTVSFLSGQVSYEDRQREVDNFNSDPSKFVFLISTKAGGVGLNITAANKVVIFDPHWNPAYDLQAQDRAYRIGQRRDVEVYRMVSAGTIEEIVYARQIYKQQQANIGYTASNERRYFKGVQEDKTRKGELFGLQNLFSFRSDQIVLQNIMNQTNIAEARVSAQMVEISVDEPEIDDTLEQVKKEDAADDTGGWRQLADCVKSGDAEEQQTNKTKTHTPKSNAVQAILSSAGVQYTHDNSEVIGSSKVEAHLSRQAEMQDSTELDSPGDHSALFAGDEMVQNLVNADASSFTPQFRPPDDVKYRQFCSMAKELGFDDVTEFALVVEQMTQEKRRDTLDRFYKKRVARLLRLQPHKEENTHENKKSCSMLRVEYQDDEAAIAVKVKLENGGTQDFDDTKPETTESVKNEDVKCEHKDASVQEKSPPMAAPAPQPGPRPISSVFIDDGEDEL
ncbi:putative DNA repair protein RAD26 [Coniella lustricola]|uniref:Putative DNA repair protein RAD26 n=1 Tax=Coniella lustricola TaxID=2025994 RepID=A0A2T3AI02_9PEZI|nr:putative DNA repair protein RAD26 [Coniella lustricola]